MTSLPGRGAAARARIPEAREALRHCDLCSFRCGVDRTGGEMGKCRAGAEARVFMAQTETADELELIPTFAIAFSGCDLRCAYCNSGESSWAPQAGEPLHAGSLAERAVQAVNHGARTVMILGGEPTIHLPAALELVGELPDDIPLIWKTNGNGTARARRLLDGLFDYWVVDYKFGNDQCAERIARAVNYLSAVQETLLWAHDRTRLIVRHLQLPGHLDCCWRPAAAWLQENLPRAGVNLARGYWPGWRSNLHRELSRPLPPSEHAEALGIAKTLRLELVQ